MDALNKILLFIPAYRCEEQISRVIQKIGINIQLYIDTILVVDNKSPDQTKNSAVRAFDNCISHCKCVVLENFENYGLGGSHKIAFQYAINNRFDYVIVLHGDDQADINDLYNFLITGFPKNIDCFLGARFMHESILVGYSKLRTIGNVLLNKMFSYALGSEVHDLGSGLNMYKVSSLNPKNFIRLPDNLTFNYLMLLETYMSGNAIRYFPITWVEEDQISNVRFISQVSSIVCIFFRFVFRRGSILTHDHRRVKYLNYEACKVYEKDIIMGT